MPLEQIDLASRRKVKMFTPSLAVFRRLILLAISLFSFEVPLASGANLILNGSFDEHPGEMNMLGYRTTFDNQSGLYGWAVLSGNVDIKGFYWTASHGDYSLDLTGTNPGAIMQSLITTPGENYAVRFDIAMNPDFIFLGAQTLRTGVFGLTETFHEYTVEPSGQTRTTMQWEEVTWYFTANTELTLFYFQSISGTGAHGPALDNVRVTLVPELSSGSLATAGLLCAFLFRKRLLFRRSAQAA